ncbi:hypothetical protein [Leptolyngbya phage Lbo-JY46]
MTQKKEYLLRWIKHNPIDENGNCTVHEFGTLLCSSYEKAIFFEEKIREHVKLKEFNKEDFMEIVPAENNIEYTMIEADDEEDY